MRSPEGQDFPNIGCYLEMIENERLVWTAALRPGYHPQASSGSLLFTAVILLERRGAGTKYTAIAIHGDEEGARKHAEMGFHRGWGTALDQLVAHVKGLWSGKGRCPPSSPICRPRGANFSWPNAGETDG
jgi:uncharacterized protein YndB with AHSA1/START domain